MQDSNRTSLKQGILWESLQKKSQAILTCKKGHYFLYVAFFHINLSKRRVWMIIGLIISLNKGGF
jgi:hypothetical protein